jgi:hypothetical protein
MQRLKCNRRGDIDGRHAPQRARCVRLQASRSPTLGSEPPKRLELHKKSRQYPLSMDEIHCRMCGATVYEISRLVSDRYSGAPFWYCVLLISNDPQCAPNVLKRAANRLRKGSKDEVHGSGHVPPCLRADYVLGRSERPKHGSRWRGQFVAKCVYKGEPNKSRQKHR